MLVSYDHDDLKKVVVEHLGTLEILKGTAASLERELCQFFDQNNIPWRNLVSILMDSCVVMRGSKTGLETRIHQHCPGLLDIDGTLVTICTIVQRNLQSHLNVTWSSYSVICRWTTSGAQIRYK